MVLLQYCERKAIRGFIPNAFFLLLATVGGPLVDSYLQLPSFAAAGSATDGGGGGAVYWPLSSQSWTGQRVMDAVVSR